MEPLLPLDRASIFVDGTVGESRLNHPEGVAVDREGNVWCGGETGELYRIAPDGSRFEVVASTGGFTLGIAFDQHGRLYSCDLGHKAVFRLDPASGRPDRFTGAGIAPVGAFRASMSSSVLPAGTFNALAFSFRTGYFSRSRCLSISQFSSCSTRMDNRPSGSRSSTTSPRT